MIRSISKSGPPELGEPEGVDKRPSTRNPKPYNSNSGVLP
jgi:hypothetical protein